MPVCMICFEEIEDFDVSGAFFDGGELLGWVHEDCLED